MPRILMCLCPIGAMPSSTSSGYSPGTWSTASLEPVRVPGHDDVREQGQGSGDRAELLHRAPMLSGDHAVVDGTLEAVNGFALVEQIEDLGGTPDCRNSRIDRACAAASPARRRLRRRDRRRRPTQSGRALRSPGTSRASPRRRAAAILPSRGRWRGARRSPPRTAAILPERRARAAGRAFASSAFARRGHRSKPTSLASAIAKCVKPWVSTATRSIRSTCCWRKAPSMAAPAWRRFRTIG